MKTSTIVIIVIGVAAAGALLYLLTAIGSQQQAAQGGSASASTNPQQNSFGLPKGFAIADWSLNFANNLWGNISSYIPKLNSSPSSTPNLGAPDTPFDTTSHH